MFFSIDDYKEICKILGYQFKDYKLLEQAMTRRSAIVGNKFQLLSKHNEAFATMGDGLLRAIIEDVLIELEPNVTKGQLSITRDKLVNNNLQSQIALSLKIGQFLIMGAEEEKNKGRSNPKILADALEAIISALFLDSDRDYLCVKRFVITHWGLQYYYNEFLAQAVTKKDPKKVEYLLQCGADPNCDVLLLMDEPGFGLAAVSPISEISKKQEGFNTTILCGAVLQKEITIAECLLKYGADMNRGDIMAMTPLYHAAYQGNVPMAKLLRSYGALFIPIFSDGYTALHIAVDSNKDEMVEYLAGEILDIDTQDMLGRTALYLAAKFGHTLCAEFLLKNNASTNIACVDKTNRRFETALHVAVRGNYITIIKLLKKYNANMNVIDNKKRTPLHYAYAKNYAEAVKLLLEYGADPDCKDNKGLRPIDLATDVALKEYAYMAKKSQEILFDSPIGKNISPFFEATKRQTDSNSEPIVAESSWRCTIL